MRSGEVVGTDLSGLGRKVFHKGDIASENNFPPGNYQKLVDAGWIKEKEIEVPIIKLKTEEEEPALIESKTLDNISFDKKSNRKK